MGRLNPALAPTRGPLAWSVGLSLALHAYALFALKVPLDRAQDAQPSVLQAYLVPRARPSAPVEVLKNTLDPPHAKPLEDPIRPPARAPKPREAPPPRELAAARPEPRGLDLRLPRPERSGTGLRARSIEHAERLPPAALRETMERLSEEMLYPAEALKRGLEGEVVILVELGEHGRILDASVASGSGHAVLDAAAVRAVRKIGTLGPSAANKAILLPVRFKIM